MYRLQVFDDRTLGMHWQTHKGGAEHERLMKDTMKEFGGTEPHRTSSRPPTVGAGPGDPATTEPHRTSSRPPTVGAGPGDPAKVMPVAIALGGDPALIYAASAPLPPSVDEVVFAGWLRGRGVEMVACRTIDLEAPAQAEIVLEGYVDPRERRLEGPFGDHTGYYSLAREYPVFHLTAITRRARPIYPTTIVGRPPEEDYWLGKATERLFVPIVRLLLPEVVDINMPAEGVFHNLVIVSIKKRYPGHARKVMTALWGMGLMMLAKTIVVVSEHVNVHDLSEVAWLGDGGDGRGAHLCDGDQPRRRPRNRRAQSAHLRAAPAHGHAPRRRAQASRGGGRRAHARRGGDAEPAVPRPGAARARLPGRLLVHQALHVDVPLDPRVHRRNGGGRRLDRRARGVRRTGLHPLVRADGVDRGLRPDLRLPGRRGGPRAGALLRPRPLRRRRRARRGASEPRAHRRGARSPWMVDRARAPLLGRLGRRRGAPGLRALAGEPAGPLASRRRLLQRQRLHRADRPRLRRRRPLAMTAPVGRA